MARWPTEVLEALNTLMELATTRVGSLGCSVFVRDPQTDLFQMVAIRGGVPGYEGTVVRPGEDMLGRVAASGLPMIVNDYLNWEGRDLDFPGEAHDVDAELCLPMTWRGYIMGVLSAFARKEEKCFEEEDIARLEPIARIAAALLGGVAPQELHDDFGPRLDLAVEEEIQQLRQARLAMANQTEELRRLLADTVAIQEEERLRIACDLHDGSNQLVVAGLYEIQAAQQALRGGKVTDADDRLETAKRLMREVENENRQIISGLHPPVFASHGLLAALRWYLDSSGACRDLSCRLEVIGSPVALSREVELAVFRIAQASLTNIREHARATEVYVRVEYRSDALRLHIRDNGDGFDPEDTAFLALGHFGLLGMRERAQSIGGQVGVWSAPSQGTNITLHVPLVHGDDDHLGRAEQQRCMSQPYVGQLRAIER